MKLNLPLGSEYRTGDGGGLAFKVISDGQVVCTERADHWSGWFEVGGLYSLEENGNVDSPDWKLPSAWSCFPWITLRPDGKIFT
jgi:hypothetical protein